MGCLIVHHIELNTAENSFVLLHRINRNLRATRRIRQFPRRFYFRRVLL